MPRAAAPQLEGGPPTPLSALCGYAVTSRRSAEANAFSTFHISTHGGSVRARHRGKCSLLSIDLALNLTSLTCGICEMGIILFLPSLRPWKAPSSAWNILLPMSIPCMSAKAMHYSGHWNSGQTRQGPVLWRCTRHLCVLLLFC